MNTVGVDTSLTTFSPASAPSSKSRSTIAQLYGVSAQALTAAGPSFGNWSPQHRMPPRAWRSTTPHVQTTAIGWEIDVARSGLRCDSICGTLAAGMDRAARSLTTAGAIQGVKKPSRRHPIHRWFAMVNLGLVVYLQRTLIPESTLSRP